MTDPETRDADWLDRETAVLMEESVRLEYLLGRARRDRDKAVLALDRLRARRAYRVASKVDDSLDATKRVLRGIRARTPLRRIPVPGLDRRPAGGSPASRGPTPATFRTSFLEALAQGRLRIGVAEPTEGAPSEIYDARATAIHALTAGGWRVEDPGPDVDCVLVVDPATDVHRLPRGPVLVAAVAAPRPWSRDERLADVDLVVVPDGEVAGALRPVAAARAVVAPRSTETASTDGAGSSWALTPAMLEPILRRWATGVRIGIEIGIPTWDVAESWGDLHFARALQRQLELHGHATRVHLLPDWTDPVAARDDVAIHLFGLSKRPVQPGQRTILWVISHPDRVTDAMLAEVDRVYVASDGTAAAFRARTPRPVDPLHQATDPDRFRVDRSGPPHEVLFVGNTRGVRRRIMEQLVPTTFDLAVYGRGWADRYPDADFVRGDHVPNHELARWYGSAAVVLNDHWPDMQAAGFLSNRLYDALASGAYVISDPVVGMDAEFDGAVVQVETAGALRWAIRHALDRPNVRLAQAERGRQAVLARHTFAHRIERILADLAGELGRPLELSR